MNPKTLKKIVKRKTAKKRAQRQTARRRSQLETDRFKEQVAQDIYKMMRSPGESRRNRSGGEYRLKKYSYNMFEYGDPLKTGDGQRRPAIPQGRRERNSRSRANKKIQAGPAKGGKPGRQNRR